MIFEPPLRSGRLERRYKRFLADIVTDEGERLTIHCPNTGSMKACAEPGWRVWFSTSDNAARKYPQTWEQVENDEGARIGVNTSRANALVEELLAAGRVPELAAWRGVRREVKQGDSRVDFLLEDEGGSTCAVEVKSVTLAHDGLGLFPDAVSTRARKHLDHLAERARSGHGAALLYCVQHTAVERVAPADDIDPDYGEALRRAADAGVRLLAWRASLDESRASLDAPVPVELHGRWD